MVSANGAAITIEVLPARLGDCLLVECHRDGKQPWRMLVDGGPSDTWPRLAYRLEAIPKHDRRLNLVVVTHIDSDHIGGILPLFSGGVSALSIDEVWFNGYQHLPDERGRSRSVAEGESLAAALTGVTGSAAAYAWNTTMNGAAIATSGEGESLEIVMPDGPTITVLSPTPRRLQILRARWVTALDRARRGEPEQLPAYEPAMADLEDLAALAAAPSPRDQSAPNGSSIAFLLEHRGTSCLFTGDAFGNVIGAGLYGLARHRGVDRIAVDTFKLPHHGSKGNVITDLIPLAPARNYLVSTNGDTFHHPDDAALARVVIGAPRGARLCFNYLTERTERWADRTLQSRYGFATQYPEASGKSLVIELNGRDQ
jgi:beta-lactamase superfamily II metal-dependent hydrolase